jgi:hypothetical protein
VDGATRAPSLRRDLGLFGQTASCERSLCGGQLFWQNSQGSPSSTDGDRHIIIKSKSDQISEEFTVYAPDTGFVWSPKRSAWSAGLHFPHRLAKSTKTLGHPIIPHRSLHYTLLTCCTCSRGVPSRLWVRREGRRLGTRGSSGARRECREVAAVLCCHVRLVGILETLLGVLVT